MSIIDVTKIKGYTPSPLTDTYLIPQRHTCGRIVYVDLSSEDAIFYPRSAVTGHRNILLKGKMPIRKCLYCTYPLHMDWMRPLYHIHPMPYWMAIQTKARRVCSNCWGGLEIINDRIPVINEDGKIEDYSLVWCPLCKYETIGFVTQRYADVARKNNEEDYKLCVTGLSEALGIQIEKKEKNTPSQNLRELGF